MNAKKPFKAKPGTHKYDMSKFKIIKPMDDEWWFELIIKSLLSFVF